MTLRLAHLVLQDKWPGVPNPNLSIPTGGWDSTRWCYKTTSTTEDDNPGYPIGTKIMAYEDNSECPGWYTMMYMAFHSIEGAAAAGDISSDFSESNFFCFHYDGSHAVRYDVDTSTVPYFVVASCYTNSTAGLCTDTSRGVCGAALACWTASGDGTAAYTQGYGDAFGWFWVGGVCPLSDVSLFWGLGDNTTLGVDITVDTLMRRGPVMAELTAASLHLFTSDVSNIIDATALVGQSGAELVIGWTCASDA